VLQALILDRAAWQRAQAQGRDRDPALVAAFQKQVIDRLRQDFLDAHRDQLAVSEAEIAAHYQAHAAEHRLPARVHAAMLFVEAPASFTPEVREERRARLAAARPAAVEVSPAEGFGPRAAEISYDQATKFKGGKLGWLVEGATDPRLDPAAVAALFALRKPGEVSEIVAGTAGFYLLRLLERQPESVRPLAQVRARIAQQLTAEKRAALERQFAGSMTADLDITIQRDAVDQFVRSSPSAPPLQESPPRAPEP